MPYQTLTLADGTVVPGLFNTPEWAEIVFRDVDLNGKRFLDLGANTGQWSVEALKRGARYLTLVEEQQELLDEAVDLLCSHKAGAITEPHNTKVEKWQPEEFCDVMVASMVIHWIDNVQHHLLRLLSFVMEKAIIVFRPDSPEAQVPGAGKWFPTYQRLASLMQSAGFENDWKGSISTPHDTSPIHYGVFRRVNRIVTDGRHVLKLGTNHNRMWYDRLGAINNQLPETYLDHVHGVNIGLGYKTDMIVGTALSGSTSFHTGTGHVDTYKPTLQEQKTLCRWYTTMVKAFIGSGFAFPDISPGNVFLDRQGMPRLIDLTDIVPVLDMEHPHFHAVPNRWLEFIGSKARFDGDLGKLLAQLEDEE